ncbi:hypothetical protein OQZ33_07130 [Pedobacter sp. MC2016-05]|uniref:hypothetical protein n=1 Tax=Pedobacter sp. MC2016-05 TaxID=2994474 RepID=UPI002248741F|nr:hypothetical protein [Pedobacter sp. MC2016-05]MCX2474098.1 hypothetical protein [Pedobacter sp. MC2016-05]
MKINYSNKQKANNPKNPNANEVFSAQDANEIKNVVNQNADKLDAVDSKVIALESQLNNIDSTVTAIDLQIDVLDSKVTALDTQIDGVDDSISQVEDKIDTGLATLNAALLTKASKINGVVPLSELPPVFFSGEITGTGTESDPFVFSGGLSAEQLSAYFQSLPNWAADKVLQGNLEWIDPPQGGDMQKLETAIIVFGVAGGDSVPVSWNTVPFGITYSLQRDRTISFANPVTIYSGAGTSFIDTGLSPVTQYFYRLRVTASGFASSNFDVDNITTDVAGNVTPAPPTVNANDTNNTLSATHALTASEILVSFNGGAYVAYTGVINVGNINLPAGYYKFKIKAAAGRNESAAVDSPAFTEAQLPKPNAPTAGVVNDTANTFNFTYTAGYTTPAAYERRIRSTDTDTWGAWTTLTAKPIVIGDISVPVGFLEVRVKAVNNVSQASEPLTNTVAFVESEPDLSVPVVNYQTLDNVIKYNDEDNSLFNVEGNYGQFNTGLVVNPGDTGYIQFNGESNVKSSMIQVTGAGFDYNGLPTNGMSLKWDYYNQDGAFTNKAFSTGKDNTGAAFYVGGVNINAPAGTVIKCRIRFDGEFMIAEYFYNAWVEVTKKPHTVPVSVGGVFAGDSGAERPRLRFIKQYNLL